MWAGDVHIKWLQGRTNAADDFAGPQGLAEQGDPAVAGFADGATAVTGIGGLVGVQAAVGEFTFEGGIFICGSGANAKAESFVGEAGEEKAQKLFRGSRDNQAARRCFTNGDGVRSNEFADTLEMAEEIDDIGLRRG